MTDGNTPSSSPPASSLGPSPPSSPPNSSVCWAAHLTAIAIAVVVGWPIGRALPELLILAGKGEWKPAAGALLVLGLLAAPAPTLGLVQSLIPSLRRPEK